MQSKENIMNIMKIKDVEDCFDGSFIKEILFDDILTKEFIHYLGKEGEFDYYSSFAKPYFKIKNSPYYILEGIEGNKTVRIVLYRSNIEMALSHFQDYIKKYESKVDKHTTQN
jgi:hypothetical protein